ncbi:MAG: hypothetical protein KBD37_08130 [Burkholderiales bacterium]|nr:hypothetical protein [Burkholderiales bacterium]
MSINNRFTLEQIANCIEIWLTNGYIEANMLADNFKFISPFWKGSNKNEFLDKFLDPTTYTNTSLSKIIKFDPVIKFKSISDDNNFAIILQYHTRNGSSVYEAVLGTIKDGLLIELSSIYDLNETKNALEL